MTYQRQERGRLAVALIHYPVLNKNHEIIGSAITNLDIHDIARASKTYGVDQYFLVTPYDDQQELAESIISHWQVGYGAMYNQKRRDALNIVRICDHLEAACLACQEAWGTRPQIWATCAKVGRQTLSYKKGRKKIHQGDSVLLLFGTGWGLTPEMMALADEILPPLGGETDYNHLSVRSAAAIVLDRLLGRKDE